MPGNIRETAYKLRSQGWSLDQITRKLNKPRSTVYYWITKVPLTTEQIKSLERKRGCGRKLGGQIRRAQRLKLIQLHNKNGLSDIAKISQRDLFLIGIALYWAEGSKQRDNNVSQRLGFTNSDPKMIIVFIKWLDLLKVPSDLRQFTLYIHRKYIKLEGRIKHTWQKILRGKISKWEKTVFKNHKTNRPFSSNYIGLIRVTIRKSTNLNRQVMGWVNAISSLT